MPRPVQPKTWMAKKEEWTDRDWYHIDADGHIVGRLATQIATVLMGKHKATYTPHVDTGGCVIVTNVERIRFTGRQMQDGKIPYLSTKMAQKSYDSYSGFPSGRRVRAATQVWEERPEMILKEAVRRMLPKNRLGRQMLKKLKLFTGPEHNHQGTQPQPFPAHMVPEKKL